MGDVRHVNFGAERARDDAHQKLAEELIRIGTLFGDDDEHLLRAKADCALGVMRSILEQVPEVELTFEIPDNLPPDQCELIREAVRAAALQGIDTARMHSVRVLTNAIYDLCTSKLAQQSHPDDH